MKENPFKKAIASRQQPTDNSPSQETEQPIKTEEASKPEPVEPLSPVKPTEPKRRGRPATGKRSDDAWVGRTYYVKRETDLDVEEVLLQLRRQGIELDKSELVDLLLSAWVKWQQGENIEIHISEITPRQK
ncbi:MAG: hypothetical protein ACM37W_00920 [Actinomycetota bacterium]